MRVVKPDAALLHNCGDQSHPFVSGAALEVANAGRILADTIVVSRRDINIKDVREIMLDFVITVFEVGATAAARITIRWFVALAV
eukprot:SAG11_NODE_1569_length_4669_cov_15.982276_2_plen_85_part_00